MARIFISYKRVDKEKVFAIIEKIEANTGEKCWVDIEGIESDAQFKNVIISAIRQSEVVLFMYSKAHSLIVDFEKDWTVRELNFASAKNKRIVFINLDRTPLTDEFSFDYGLKQQVDGQSAEAINHLISDLKKWLKLHESSAVNQYSKTDSIPAIRENSNNSDNQSISSLSETSSKNIDTLADNGIIQFTIFDKETPLAILIGPPSIGKTMTLVRLSRFLSEHGHHVIPNSNFRPSSDERYRRTCAYFRNQIFSTFASNGTANRDSILIDIRNTSGRKLLQLIDLPGEFFFNPVFGNEGYNYQIPTIMTTPNQHIWIIFIELGWENMDTRQKYVKIIRKYRNIFSIRDKVIILCNKIDKLPYYTSNRGSIDMKSLINSIKNEYPGLLSLFENKNPLTRLFCRYNCTILPFSSGTFTESGTNTIFIPSKVDFPLKLWKEFGYK